MNEDDKGVCEVWRSRYSDFFYEGTQRGQDELLKGVGVVEDRVMLIAPEEDEWRKMLTQAKTRTPLVVSAAVVMMSMLFPAVGRGCGWVAVRLGLRRGLPLHTIGRSFVESWV